MNSGTKMGLHCPTCGGPLQEQPTRHGQLRLQCLVDHRFSADDLLTIYADSLTQGKEYAWANTVQLLTEYLTLARRLAQLARSAGHLDAAEELTQHIREAEARVQDLRQGNFAS